MVRNGEEMLKVRSVWQLDEVNFKIIIIELSVFMTE